MDKTEIKKKIDDTSNSLISLYGRDIGNTRTVLTIFIGVQSFEIMSRLLRESFNTTFKTKPIVLEMEFSDLTMNIDSIMERFSVCLKNAGEKGINLQNLRVAYIALMDDPIFEDNNESFIERLDTALHKFRRMGLRFQDSAFYGIFRASNISACEYEKPMTFIRTGKNIWNNIIHMEVPFYIDDLKRYTEAIAVHCIADSYDMAQDMKCEGYAWKSIYLHCLKVPEFIISRLLFSIYSTQIGRKIADLQKWRGRIETNLERILDSILCDETTGCEQFIPLKFVENNLEKPLKKGFFFRKSTEENLKKYRFSDIAINEMEMGALATNVYENRKLDEKDCDHVLEGVITSAESIDDNLAAVSKLIDNVLESIKNVYQERKKVLSNRIYDVVEESDIDKLLLIIYQQEKEIAILNKKMVMITVLREHLRSNETIGRVMEEIIRRNRELLEILQDLSINEYGGTLREFTSGEELEFRINQPVEEVLSKLDATRILNVISDKRIVLEQFKSFLNREYIRLNDVHMLGEIGPDLNILNPINTVMMMPPSQANDTDFKEVIRQSGEMEIMADGIFRESTFYMMSKRYYSSEKYIQRYIGSGGDSEWQ